MTFYSNPKRKDYVLNPRGKALYDDSNRFGTKMLEKMGWSKGKGLGASLNGQLDFIKVSHKSDQKGIGFQDRDDQWTSHENNFNSLLKSIKSLDNSDEELQDFAVKGFRNDENVFNNDEIDKKDKLLSGISLEEQSKKSRARVHYKKFTRGKDISRYSEKDLANIFGKKSLNAEAEIVVDTENNSSDAMADKETPNFGITTIETGTTITEYFKKKMKKAGDKFTSSENSEIENVNENVFDAANKTDKKKPKKLKTGSTGCEQRDASSKESVIEVSENLPQIQERENYTKRKHNSDSPEQTKPSKKKKKDKVLTETIEIVERESVNHFHNGLSSSSEKSKNDTQIVETLPKSPEKEVNREQKPSLSKKSKKSKKTKRGKERESSNSMTDRTQEEDRSTVLNDNVYEIRAYRAEIFRYFDLDGFSGSSLSDIPGYGYTKDMSLIIVDKSNDGKLINTLWNDTRNKYAHFEDGNKAKKKKKFVEHIQDLKKKNIFKV